MENLTFILVLLDHTSQEESRNFKGIPGTEGTQSRERLHALPWQIHGGLFPALTRGAVFKGPRAPSDRPPLLHNKDNLIHSTLY